MIRVLSYRYFFRFLPCALLFLTSSASAVDLNNDGNSDIFIYRQGSKVVHAYSTRGAFVGQVGVPTSVAGTPPLLFPGKDQNTSAVFTLNITGTNQEGTLYRLDANGGQQSKSFGSMRDSAVMVYDINNNGLTDAIKIERSGAVSVYLEVFTASEQKLSPSIDRLKKNSRATVTSIDGNPYIVIYTSPVKKKRTNFVLYPILAGSKQTFQINRRFRDQLYPHMDSSGFVDGHFSTYKRRSNGSITTFRHLDLLNKSVRTMKIAASTALIPGYFDPSGSDLQAFTVSGTGKVIDLRNNGAVIAELDLSSLPGPAAPPVTPTPGNPTPTPSNPNDPNPTPTPFPTQPPLPTPINPGNPPLPPTPPLPTPVVPTPTPVPTPFFGCNKTYPTQLMEQIRETHAAGGSIQPLFNQLQDLRLCPTVYQQVRSDIDDLFLSRSLSFGETALAKKKKKKRRRRRRRSLRSTTTRNNSGAIITAPIVSLLSTANSGGGGDQGGSESPSDLGCDTIDDGTDGPGGFLLKGSEKDDTLVVLLPSTFSTTKTELIRPNGNPIETLRYTGRSNPDANGARETWRGRNKVTSYPKQLYVRAFNMPFGTDVGVVECFRIDDSHVRND